MQKHLPGSAESLRPCHESETTKKKNIYFINLFSEHLVVENKSGTVNKMPALPLCLWKPETCHHYQVYPHHLLDGNAGV